MNINCNCYPMTDEISIYEFENDEGFDYYVADEMHMVFSFGSFKDCDKNRFFKDELKDLFNDGYFDLDVEKLNAIAEMEENQFQTLISA